MAIIISRAGTDRTQVVPKFDFELERNLQTYICDHPEAIPVEDKRLLVVARELPTESGPIDAFAVDKDGDLYIVETKLYRNPDKRTVVAQALDYGASLWRRSDFSQLLSTFDEVAQDQWKMPFRDKLADFFSVDEASVDAIIECMRRNLSDGVIKFVVLMDQLGDRLKDLITYVNENSKFDIYAVELEFYKYEEYEIVIPKLYGAEVKKDARPRSPADRWDWDRFKERLIENEKEGVVVAAQQIKDWAEKNNIRIDWMRNQCGSFILAFCTDGKKNFYPFRVTGQGEIEWSAPRQGDRSPRPFDRRENRAEILKRLQLIKGATVDLENVDRFTGLKLPLCLLAEGEARNAFLSVCLWIKEELRSRIDIM